MANAKLICALLPCMVVSAPMLNVEASLPCHTVGLDLGPCLPYLRQGGRVPRSCCDGVRKVNNSAKTTKDRRDTCICLKRLANQFGTGVNAKFAADLPKICKVRIPNGIKISGSTDCKSIP